MERKSHFWASRSGRNKRIGCRVVEQYNRGDLEFGVLGHLSQSLDASSIKNLISCANQQHLVVPDTNIVLSQMDVIEQLPDAAFLILQTVLQELQHLNTSVYQRLLQMVKDENHSVVFYANEFSSETTSRRASNESVNDWKDRLIRRSVAFFSSLTANTSSSVIMISNDKGNRSKAEEEGIQNLGIFQYISKYYPEQLDLVGLDEHGALSSSSSSGGSDDVEEHLSVDEISAGLKACKYYRGVIRVKRKDWTDCYAVIFVDGERKSVSIKGAKLVNRAVDGDVVALKVLEQEFGESETNRMNAIKEKIGEEVNGEEGLSYEASLPCPAQVVGIIRRNWRQYAGSLAPAQAMEGSHDEFQQCIWCHSAICRPACFC